MADGFDIHLDQARAEQLKAAADASGMTATEFALSALDRAIEDDWAEDRRRLEDYDRTGDALTIEEAMSELRNATAEKRAARG